MLPVVLGGGVWGAAATGDPTGLPRVMGSICRGEQGDNMEIRLDY